jgi:hypothetical protein
MSAAWLRVPARAATVGAALILVAFLAAGLPPFVRMPLWADVTLYDVAARNVLRGGVHYRDVFDTNPPGIVWAQAGLRTLLGWRPEALRLADVAILAGVIVLLVGHVWRPPEVPGPGPGAARLWTALALAAFYLATSEGNHCQRDLWMLLPALAALYLRRHTSLKRQRRPFAGASGLCAWALAEGLCWGTACWIKPFVLVPAAACWLATTLQDRGGPRRLLALDGTALLGGGLLAAAAGGAWLLASGAWPYFVDVFLNWNREYAAGGPGGRARTLLLLGVFRPWGLVHLLAVPAAVGALRGRHALLAAFYLGWLLQAAYLQRGHEYVLAPTVLLALTLIAARLVLRPPGRAGRLALLGVAAFLAMWHPALKSERLALWSRCWHESSAELRDRLRLVGEPLGTDWTDLARVAEFLRRLDLRDGELTCYHNFTHPLLLELGLKPSTPFLHFDTTLHAFPRRREHVRETLAASRQRCVVSDLLAAGLHRGQTEADLPPQLAHLYPWSEPVVFRAGRYAVHRVTGPVAQLLPEPPRTSRGPRRHGR